MQRLRVASRALGERETVYVHVYDTISDMRAAGMAFNGNDQTDALGITQAWTDDNDRTTAVVVRLARGHLGTTVTSHEMHHAATALYGAHVADRPSRRAHLNHWNEPFAHLYSDLYGRLIEHLYSLGYYDKEP